jgi:hypothetical protein
MSATRFHTTSGAASTSVDALDACGNVGIAADDIGGARAEAGQCFRAFPHAQMVNTAKDNETIKKVLYYITL